MLSTHLLVDVRLADQSLPQELLRLLQRVLHKTGRKESYKMKQSSYIMLELIKKQMPK